MSKKEYAPIFIDSGELLNRLDDIIEAHLFAHGDNPFVEGLEYARDIVKEKQKNAQKTNGFMR